MQTATLLVVISRVTILMASLVLRLEKSFPSYDSSKSYSHVTSAHTMILEFQTEI